MKPDISEFSYGFALTDDLVHNLPGVSAAPVFPSLYREGQPGGGYDVMLQQGATPLFIQFKLCDYMKRGTAFESKHGLLDCPFYRMHLRPKRHSEQHTLLLELEQAGQLVYYAAPMFHRVSELNDAFLSGKTVERSIWIHPATIGPLPDSKDHHVSFTPGGDAFLCSKPSLIHGPVDSAAMIERLKQAVASEAGTPEANLKEIESVLERLAGIAKLAGIAADEKVTLDPDGGQVSTDKRWQQVHPLERLALYARRVFDSQVYLVRRSES